ncbi:MAG: hypothetical protein HC905_28550 [Bacteroidales bacterium]|nr:hypothetical protein [Bacteroidales bacterium]
MPDLNESDFEDAPYQADAPVPDFGFNPAADSTKNINAVPGNNIQNGDPSVIVQPKERVFDPDFTTDIVVDTIDTLQFSLFMALQTRKQKSIRFKDREEYLEAIHLNYLTDPEIEKLENPDEKQLLVQKLKAFRESMAKINEKQVLLPTNWTDLKSQCANL